MSTNGEDEPTDTPGSGDQPQEGPGRGPGVEQDDNPDLRPEAAPPAPTPKAAEARISPGSGGAARFGDLSV